MILPLLLYTAVLVPGDQWLVGAWALERSSCETNSAISFDTDGTYNHAEGEGAWVLAGQRLTISSMGGDDFGRSEIVQVKGRGPLEMELEWPDGTRARFRRCEPQS